MNIKFVKQASQLNNRFWTDTVARAFMQEKQGELIEAVRHNMNYYKILENGLFVHIYDAYAVDTK